MKPLEQSGLLRVRSERIRSVRGSRDRTGAARQTTCKKPENFNKPKIL